MSFVVRPILNLQQDGATCTYLKFQDISILLDCGWTENSHLDKYRKESKYDAVNQAVEGHRHHIPKQSRCSILRSIPISSIYPQIQGYFF